MKWSLSIVLLLMLSYSLYTFVKKGFSTLYNTDVTHTLALKNTHQCVWFSTFKVNHTVTKHYFLSNIEKWTGSEPEAKFWLKLVGTPCASMFNFASVWSWRYFLRSLCPWERRPFDAIIFPHYFEVYKSLLDSHTHGWSDFHDAAPQMHFFQILS